MSHANLKQSSHVNVTYRKSFRDPSKQFSLRFLTGGFDLPGLQHIDIYLMSPVFSMVCGSCIIFLKIDSYDFHVGRLTSFHIKYHIDMP